MENNLKIKYYLTVLQYKFQNILCATTRAIMSDQELINEHGGGDSDSDIDIEVVDERFPRVDLKVSNSAFGQQIRQFDLVNNGFDHIEEFLLNAFNLYQQQINEVVLQYDMIKTLSYFSAEFERSHQVNEQSDPLLEKRMIHMPTKMHEIDSQTNIIKHFQRDIIDYIVQQVDEVMIEGSGFTLSRIEKLRVQIFKYQPLSGSGFIELPKILKNKRAIINLKNTYNECFKWSILAALHYDEVFAKNKNKANDATRYRLWSDELNFNGINFPVRLNQIEKFMQQNEQIAINVYYFDEEKKRVCPLFLASKAVENRYIHLLLLTEPEAEAEPINISQGKSLHNVSVNSHYCWIKNLSALVGSQLSKHGHKAMICDRCLFHFTTQEKLEKHRIICGNMNECAIEMPGDGENFEKFKNYKNEMKTPFIIYADTETLLKPPDSCVFNENCSTHAHQEHEAHSVGYYFKHENNESRSRYASHRSENCVNWFMSELIKIADEAYEFFENEKKTMKILTAEEKKQFAEATFCHICKNDFNENISDVRVKDHCHISGVFRGAAHQSCNLQYQISRTIPIVMHNLSGYDSHLLIKKLGCADQIPGKITIIPHNSENYISFIKSMHAGGGGGGNKKKRKEEYVKEIKFKFIDSLRFMSASLDYLASLIPEEKKFILKSECERSGYRSDMMSLLCRKNPFPYEYVDKYEKLEETKLPPEECFYSSLTDSHVSEEDYKHAQNVWTSFGLRTLGEYSDLYLKTDVLLLADVFENFRSTCQATHSLDAAHYFGAPGLSFDAMLKYTNESIELFTDPDMLLFAERGIRGGISQINKRYAKANNIYMGEDFDSTKESTYLMYLDGKNVSLYFCFFIL